MKFQRTKGLTRVASAGKKLVINYQSKNSSQSPVEQDISNLYNKFDELQIDSDRKYIKINNLSESASQMNDLSESLSKNIEKIDSAMSKISKNTTDIQTNKDAISSVSASMQANAESILSLQEQVLADEQNIQQNASNILANAEAIARNAETQAQNTQNLSARIDNAENSISALNQSKQDVLMPGENISIENNVISSTVDNTSMHLKLDKHEADIASNQNNIATILNMLTQYKTQIDDMKTDIANLENMASEGEQNYDQTFDHLYDEYDRSLNISGGSEVVLPNVIFGNDTDITHTSESGDVETVVFNGKITASINFSISCADTISFVLYDASAVIYTGSKTYTEADVGNTLTYSFKVPYPLAVNNHNLYLVCKMSTAVLTATHTHFEIFAPNATISNKIEPFDVTYNYYTNKYYISDCSSGIAMLAEIDADSIASEADIVWQNSGIEAQNYKTYFIGATDNTSSELGKRYAIITKKDNTAQIVDYEDSSLVYNFPAGTAFVSASMTKHNYTLGYYLVMYKNTTQAYYITLSQNMELRSKTSVKYSEDFAYLDTIRNNLNYLADSYSWIGFQTLYKGATAKYFPSYSSNLTNSDIPLCSSAKIYMKKCHSSINFDFYYYYRQFGKFYVRDYNYGNTNILGEPTLIGEYQNFFAGKNGDMFVVENNQLKFVKAS